ncbi:type III PLP-dependent enzyme [Streptomyces anulatus]|uniref:Type III PLP-dependent enzyme n=1 Tax=Streptomyces anulatus TaxID=1892 RepID=A0ABZ1Z8K1_STRAQ|nr:type III PLP-dependent enzyme [Streptomyces anulatus]
MSEISTLMQRYGSPLYVYRLDALERACADLRSLLPAPSVLYYSLKANPHRLLARALRRAGCRAEVSSAGELDAALDAGFDGADCFYTGPGKTDAEVADALARGVRRFSVESAGEMRRLGRTASAVGAEAIALLRVNGDSAGSTGLRMTGAATQFGVDEAQVMADPGRFTDVPGTRLVGVHLFPISNARDEDSLIDSFRASITLAGRLRDLAGLPMSVVDLGGGFAAPYARPGERPAYPRLGKALRAALDDELPGWNTGKVEVAFESGRYLTGDSGQLAATVREVKRSREQSFMVLDTGVNHLGGMSGLGRLARASATPDPGAGATVRATLVGPLCTPADVLGRGVEVPDVGTGDCVVIPNVGAYGLTASLVAFLGRPAPAEVVLRGAEVVSATRLRLSHEPISDTPGSEEA